MGKCIDLTNLRFGKLVVLKRDLTKHTEAAYWLCKCDCGNIISVRGDALRSGRKINCGCEKKKKEIDTNSLIGQTFGRLTVIERDLTKPIGKGHPSYWICECECGNKVSICYSQLSSGKTKSCGCLRKELVTKKNTLDLTNKRFGRLIALKNTYELSEHNSYIWLCKCDCGRFHKVSAENLQSGKVNSCGLCYDKRSHGEQKIIDILESNNIKYISQYSFDDCRSKNNRLLMFDFALFDDKNNLLRIVEYDGEQHFNERCKYYTEEGIERDQIKNNYCKNNNITLVRIPYTEFNNISLETIMSNKFII